jgi:sec-independent protein translocase protein TatB
VFDIGFSELLLVGIIALLVLGPERLPQAARTAGLWAGRLRATVQRFTADVDRELKAEELRQTLREEARRLAEPVEALHRDVTAGIDLTPAANGQGDASTPAQSPAPNKASAAGDGT